MVLNLYEITGERKVTRGYDWKQKIQIVAANPADAIEACESKLHEYKLKVRHVELVYEDVLLALP